MKTGLNNLGGIVHAMQSIIDLRDPDTAGHQRRTAALAGDIAREIGFSEQETEGIRTAALLHDIGKLAVPMDILTKSGNISHDEFSIIRRHPGVSYQILRWIDFPGPVAQAVLQHHERLDGSGYPCGLSGKDIILESRILCVADVVEAMASRRPYRPAPGLASALAEISQGRGTLYDPGVVDACMRLCGRLLPETARLTEYSPQPPGETKLAGIAPGYRV